MKARVSEETERGEAPQKWNTTCRKRPMRNLKEARVKSAAQTKVNLRKAGSVGEKAWTIKTQFPIRKRIKY